MENLSNIEIEKYIDDSRISGMSDRDIKNNLLASGWTEDALSFYFQAPDTTTKPKRKWLKIILTGLGCLGFLAVILIFIIPQILNTYWSKDDMLNDSDLILKAVNIPQDQNSYYDIIKLSGLIHEPKLDTGNTDKYGKGDNLDPETTKEILQNNVEALAVLDKVVTKTFFQVPNLADVNGLTLEKFLSPTTEYLTSIRSLSRLSVLYSNYLLSQNKNTEAINQLLKNVALSQQIYKSNSPLIDNLVAIAVKKMAVSKLVGIVKVNNLSKKDRDNLLSMLESFKDNDEVLAKSFKFEYAHDVAVVDSVAGNDDKVLNSRLVESLKKGFYYFKLNQTKNMFAEQTRRNIQVINTPCTIEPKIETPHYNLWHFPYVQLVFTENAVGKLLFDELALDLSISVTRKCEIDDLFINLQTQLSQQ